MSHLQKTYLGLSTAAIPFLLLLLPPSLLPTVFTGISSAKRPLPASQSLLFVALLRCGETIFDWIATHEAGTKGPAVAEASVVLNVYTSAVLTTHLLALSHSYYHSLPTPSDPSPARPVPSKSALILIAAYLYPFIHVVPLLDTGLPSLPASFVKPWTVYFVPTDDWSRNLRPVLLVPPLLLTIYFGVLVVITLWSHIGHPDLAVPPTLRHWATAGWILLCAGGGIAYVITEQVLGWQEIWWPRVLEALPPWLVLLALGSSATPWRPYLSWLRLRRPTPPFHQAPGSSSVLRDPAHPFRPLSPSFGDPSDPEKRLGLPATLSAAQLDPPFRLGTSIAPPSPARAGANVKRNPSARSSFFPPLRAPELPPAPAEGAELLDPPSSGAGRGEDTRMRGSGRYPIFDALHRHPTERDGQSEIRPELPQLAATPGPDRAVRLLDPPPYHPTRSLSTDESPEPFPVSPSSAYTFNSTSDSSEMVGLAAGGTRRRQQDPSVSDPSPGTELSLDTVYAKARPAGTKGAARASHSIRDSGVSGSVIAFDGSRGGSSTPEPRSAEEGMAGLGNSPSSWREKMRDNRLCRDE